MKALLPKRICTGVLHKLLHVNVNVEISVNGIFWSMYQYTFSNIVLVNTSAKNNRICCFLYFLKKCCFFAFLFANHLATRDYDFDHVSRHFTGFYSCFEFS